MGEVMGVSGATVISLQKGPQILLAQHVCVCVWVVVSDGVLPTGSSWHLPASACLLLLSPLASLPLLISCPFPFPSSKAVSIWGRLCSIDIGIQIRQEWPPNIGMKESRSPGWDPRVAGTSVSWLIQMPAPAARLKNTGPRVTDKLGHS